MFDINNCIYVISLYSTNTHTWSDYNAKLYGIPRQIKHRLRHSPWPQGA